MKITTINPSTEEILCEYNKLSNDDIKTKLSNSEETFKNFKETSFDYRADLITKVSEILFLKRQKLAELMALEMGKPLLQGLAEVDKCSWVCKYYAENAELFLKDEFIKTDASSSFVTFKPLGPVLAVMPWNFPFWQVFRFAAPALMAGNTGLLKHSSNTMGCAVEIEKIFLEAGFPDAVFQNLVIGSESVADIIRSKEIKAVTLTGSTPVGQKVASVAGSVLKKTVMELGGSDPYIILKDANIEKAAETCAIARLINSGQSCIAAKRFIVDKSVLNEFEEKFCHFMSNRKMGNPLDLDVNIGPQARKDLQTDLQRQVDDSLKRGAGLILGGSIPEGIGYFYPPTVITNVKEGMAAYNEELFGPVAAVISAEDENDAVRIANDTVFGLGAAVFTEDIEKGVYLAKNKIEAGACFVNDFVKSDPRLPFGGIKESGFGRELSVYGIKEFLNIKTISVK